MKKIIALIVVCIMMFSFTGCEKKDDGNTLDIFYLNMLQPPCLRSMS